MHSLTTHTFRFPLSFLGSELDSASTACGDDKSSHRCALFDSEWKKTESCVDLEWCLDKFWHVCVLPRLAHAVHELGMHFVFVPMTRSFGGKIPRHELIGRVTTPAAWQCSSDSGLLAISVPIPHPSSWYRLGDAVPEGASAVNAVVEAVVGAVSEAAATAVAKASQTGPPAKRRRRK